MRRQNHEGVLMVIHDFVPNDFDLLVAVPPVLIRGVKITGTRPWENSNAD